MITLTVVYLSLYKPHSFSYTHELPVKECPTLALSIKKQVKAGRIYTFCGNRRI